MSFLGDLALGIGFVGLIVYLCMMVVRFSGRASGLATSIRRHEESIARLRSQVQELKQHSEEVSPQVDEVVGRMIELRNLRDHLCMRLDEMHEKTRDPDVEIRMKQR